MTRPTHTEVETFLETHRGTDGETESLRRRMRNYLIGPFYSEVTRQSGDILGVDRNDCPLTLRWDGLLTLPALWVPTHGWSGVVAEIALGPRVLSKVQMSGIFVESQQEVQEALGDWAVRVIVPRSGRPIFCTEDAYYVTASALEDYMDDEFQEDWTGVGPFASDGPWKRISPHRWRDLLLSLMKRFR